MTQTRKTIQVTEQTTPNDIANEFNDYSFDLDNLQGKLDHMQKPGILEIVFDEDVKKPVYYLYKRPDQE
tara:strand:- start:1259 stop:1465 length:207 start_codon:yes stop_codon:yes gene_type:complete